MGFGPQGMLIQRKIIVDDDLPLTQARLALIRAAQITLATGLRLLGVVRSRSCAVMSKSYFERRIFGESDQAENDQAIPLRWGR